MYRLWLWIPSHIFLPPTGFYLGRGADVKTRKHNARPMATRSKYIVLAPVILSTHTEGVGSTGRGLYCKLEFGGNSQTPVVWDG